MTQKKKHTMAQHPILSKRTKRSEAYENLLCSLDTDGDSQQFAFDNPAALELDRE